MEMMHNATFLLNAPGLEGVYRVLAVDNDCGVAGCVKIDELPKEPSVAGEEKTAPEAASSEKKPAGQKKANRRMFLSAAPHRARLKWLPIMTLELFESEAQLKEVDIELDGSFYGADQELLAFDDSVDVDTLSPFEARVFCMKDFLNPAALEESLIDKRSLSSLVEKAMARGKRGKVGIYKLISLLCRNGFSQAALRTREDRQGGAGKPRPCDEIEGGRKKPGPLNTAQTIATAYGEEPPKAQPAVSSEWESRILAADARIPAPKPKMQTRCDSIIRIGFTTRYKQVDGKLIEQPHPQFSIPTNRQISRVLRKRIPELEALIRSTTKGHYDRNIRGLVGRSWEGVAGPGHTWAIDSGVGDIYLVSSVNRAWIIGRPVVYIIVDVWSTAIVGFYVCLRGPSWDMASQALFAAAAGSKVMSGIYGFDCGLGLFPEPTLCFSLLCDRGEYLSKAARRFAEALLQDLAYAAPYRPDWKGIVEVIHRIEKDMIVPWIPGAGDARMKELERRGFRPNDAVMTVQEFIAVLAVEFKTYNLTADRNHRVDPAMKMAGIHPSPSGLWNWGHHEKIANRRKVSELDLYTHSLPMGLVSITGRGIKFKGREYECQQAKDEQWTTMAKNFGKSVLNARHFGGSTSKIWTPNPTGPGLLHFNLSQTTTASGFETDDEMLDSNAFHLLSKDDREYARMVTRLQARVRADEIIALAKERTLEAKEKDRGTKPTMTDARKLENDMMEPTTPDSGPEAARSEPDDVEELYARLEEEARRRMEAEETAGG